MSNLEKQGYTSPRVMVLAYLLPQLGYRVGAVHFRSDLSRQRAQAALDSIVEMKHSKAFVTAARLKPLTLEAAFPG